MADTSESSEHIDTEGTSTTEESINLVNTVDDPTLDWVGTDPRGITSIYSYTGRKAYMVVKYGGGHEGFKEISKS